MPPKRKAPAEPLPSEPSRRKLRSDGPVTPARPPPKLRATTRATRRTANVEPEPKVLEPLEPTKKKPEARATRSKTVAGPSKTEKVPPKRATKKTPAVAMEVEVVPEVDMIEPPTRRGKPPGVRPAEVEEQVFRLKPPSRKPPSTKPPPSTKLPSRASTRTSTRTAKARAGPSKSTTKSTRSRTTKDVPAVAEEDEPEEEDEEPAPQPDPPRQTTPVRPRIIMDAVEIVTPSRPRQPFTSNLNTSIHTKPSPTKPLSSHLPVIAVEPTTPSRSRVPPPTSPGKRRRSARSPSPEPPRLPSPRKRVIRSGAFTTPGATRIAKLPAHYHPCLHAQKRAIMAALKNPPELDTEGDQDESPSTNELAYDDLCDLLTGSVVRGEGNSCLLIGPRGSGKTRLVDRALAQVSNDVSPIVIRLSGHIQQNDRLAIREIAWQLSHQTGKHIALEDEENGGNADVNEEEMDRQDVTSLPPPAYLPSLISTLPSQPKPVVVILDDFDEFALHGRQALLYCLLDTVQSCRVGSGLNGLAVIGVTNRVDTINLLEKRVKSRFSGRMLRTAGLRNVRDWWRLTSGILTVPLGKGEDVDGWKELWGGSVKRFLEERSVKTALHETWALVKDVRMLTRILTTPVLTLSPTSPFLTPASLLGSIAEQRCPVGNSFLASLPYPAICLLIASVHIQTAGHDTFTFEMLHQLFRDQVRISIAAPVQIEGGGSIGMVKCSRQVMMGAFEHLVSVRVFVNVSAASSMVAKEFVKYRSSVERDDVKRTVEKLGTMSLKKWLGKSQQVHN